MSANLAPTRFYSLDLTRGLLIILMVFGHTMAFFHSGTYPFLLGLSGLADLICFTGLLFLSGSTAFVAYLHPVNSHRQMATRVLKRLFIYLLGYYLLSLVNLYFRDALDTLSLWRLLTFQTLVPYTEFIPVFILFGLVKIPFKPVLSRLAQSLPLTLASGFILYGLGYWLNSLTLPAILVPYQALFSGSPGYYTFPLLAYSPVYLLGIWVGARLFLAKAYTPPRELVHLALLLSIFSLCLIPLGLNRFPPSPLFLLTGATLTLWLVLLFIKVKHLRFLPWTQTLLLLVGFNAYAVYWSHTLLLFIAQGLGAPPVASLILALLIAVASLALSLYLAKILPLNYRYGLSVYALVEDFRLTPAEEHRLVRLSHRFFTQLLALPQLFSLRLGRRRVKLISGPIVFAAIVFGFILAGEAGVAEELLLNRTLWQNQSGQVSQAWVIPQSPPLNYTITLPKDFSYPISQLTVYLLIDDQPLNELQRNGSSFSTQIDPTTLTFGTHTVAAGLLLDQALLASAPTLVHASAPLYVSFTLDWEGYDVPDNYLDSMTQISKKYELPLTHMFNPRIYTAPGLSQPRAESLTQYLKNRLAQGDDLGLHLHLFPDYLIAAGLPYKPDQTWGGGFSEGYDTLTTAYTYAELKQLFAFSKNLFVAHGLPEPVLYRAGAWFADLTTLRALADSGFVADTSARTAYRFGTKQVPGPWDVSPTTLPYYPSTLNQNSNTPPPNLSILEIPNNGADDYAFPLSVMLERVRLNFQGEPLLAPRQLTFLSHPQWLTTARAQQMSALFDQLSQISAASGQGPVVFSTLTQIYAAFR